MPLCPTYVQGNPWFLSCKIVTRVLAKTPPFLILFRI